MKRAQGSVVPYVAVMLFVLVLSIQYVYSAYKLSNESTRLQNTADAAAYSAAATAAQSYNFMALSNRAMIANQITIAQLTTMMSWMRMLRTFSGTIYSLTQYIPYVSQIVAIVDYWIGLVKDIVEMLMPVLEGAVNVYLLELSQKQNLYMEMMTQALIVDVIEEVVEKNDPDVDYSFATASILAGMFAGHAESFTRNDCQDEADKAEDEGDDAEDNDARYRCRQFRNVMLASKDGFTKDRLYDLGLPGMEDGLRFDGVGIGKPPNDFAFPIASYLKMVRAGGTTMAGTHDLTPFGTWTALDTISIHGSTEWSSGGTKNHGELLKMGAGSAISGDESCGECHFMHEGTAYWDANPRASMCTDPWHEDNRHSDDPETVTNMALDFFSTSELSCSDLRDEYKEDISSGAYGGLQPFADLKDKGLVQDKDHIMVYLRKDRADLPVYSRTPFAKNAGEMTRIDKDKGAVGDSLHAASAATVTFRRDSDRWMLKDTKRLDGKIEFGNAYNPFWEARLDKLTESEKTSVKALMRTGG